MYEQLDSTVFRRLDLIRFSLLFNALATFRQLVLRRFLGNMLSKDVKEDAVDGLLRASMKENGRIGDEVTRLLIEDADEGINAAFDVRVKSVWAKPTVTGDSKHSNRRILKNWLSRSSALNADCYL